MLQVAMPPPMALTRAWALTMAGARRSHIVGKGGYARQGIDAPAHRRLPEGPAAWLSERAVSAVDRAARGRDSSAGWLVVGQGRSNGASHDDEFFLTSQTNYLNHIFYFSRGFTLFEGGLHRDAFDGPLVIFFIVRFMPDKHL